jgi:hypothetical protein
MYGAEIARYDKRQDGDGMKKIVIIDNYDSFTYNLAHLVRSLGADVDVLLNDRFVMDDLAVYDKIILSPGPGVPREAGQLMEVVRRYAGRKPILGVCLGHQAIAEVYGARLENLGAVFHGVATEGSRVDGEPLFEGVPKKFLMGRYHSWVVSREGFPDCLEITADTPDGQIMALRHRHKDVRGIQFHPESVLTPMGRRIVGNWLAL